MIDAELGLDGDGGGGKGLIGGRGGEDNEVDIPGLETRVGQGRLGGEPCPW